MPIIPRGLEFTMKSMKSMKGSLRGLFGGLLGVRGHPGI
jgi:hypothetical protein